jgi:hypothetical protein
VNLSKLSTQEQTQASADAAPAPEELTVKLEGAKELETAISDFKTFVSETVKPKAQVSSTEAGQKVEESFEVKESKRFSAIAEQLRYTATRPSSAGLVMGGKGTGRIVKEDITSSNSSGALGQEWMPSAIVLPSALPANLRRFCQVKMIDRGMKQVNWVTVTTPAYGSLTEDTSPSDVTNTVTEITAIPTETGAKQRVSYIVMESATPDLVQAVEQSFQFGALIDEDSAILTALDSATPAATLYGDESVTSEGSITTSMTFAPARLASALKNIQLQGYAIGPGDLVAVLHPVQYDALLKSTAINEYLNFGSTGPIQQGVLPQVYGVDIVRSSKVPSTTDGSSGATVYHAQVFLKAQYKGTDPASLGVGGAVGLGISRDLMIETWRKIDERDFYIVASHRIAAAVLQPLSVVAIHTC